ncbi:hypothetical protein HZS_4081, partial [Henneguya salminicola]
CQSLLKFRGSFNWGGTHIAWREIKDRKQTLCQACISHNFWSIHIEINCWEVITHTVLTYFFHTSGKYIIPTPTCPSRIALINSS